MADSPLLHRAGAVDAEQRHELALVLQHSPAEGDVLTGGAAHGTPVRVQDRVDREHGPVLRPIGFDAALERAPLAVQTITPGTMGVVDCLAVQIQSRRTRYW